MKKILIIPFILFLGCSSTKKSTAPKFAGQQLIKDIEILSSDKFEGRKTGTKGNDLARAHIINRLKDIGLSPYPNTNGFVQNFELQTKNGSSSILAKNVIAYIPGKTDDILVISAHYDHLGIVNGQIFNGADDNASGVSGVLQFANYFKHNKPNYSMLFVFFDAEEIGLQGAKHFVQKPLVALEKIKMNINLDMIGRNDKAELYVAGTYKYPALKKYITNTNTALKLLTGHDDPKLGRDDWTNQSDQGAFNEKNIPFLYFGVEDHKDYHKETDEFKNINQKFFIDAANTIQQVIINIDNEKDLQTIFKKKLIMK